MKPGKFDATILTLGFAFLYIPILILVIYSFNESKLVTVWGGFSLKWYGEMWRNDGLMSAAWVTLQVFRGHAHAVEHGSRRDPEEGQQAPRQQGCQRELE